MDGRGPSTWDVFTRKHPGLSHKQNKNKDIYTCLILSNFSVLFSNMWVTQF
jgi:hypothetical protein